MIWHGDRSSGFEGQIAVGRAMGHLVQQTMWSNRPDRYGGWAGFRGACPCHHQTQAPLYCTCLAGHEGYVLRVFISHLL